MEITPEKLYAMYLTAHNLLTQCTPTQDISLSCRLGTPPTVLIGGKEYKVEVFISNHPDEDEDATPA